MTTDITTPPTLYSVDEVLEHLPVSKATVFKLISKGELRAMKIGRRTLVSETALAEYVASREVAGWRA